MSKKNNRLWKIKEMKKKENFFSMMVKKNNEQISNNKPTFKKEDFIPKKENIIVIKKGKNIEKNKNNNIGEDDFKNNSYINEQYDINENVTYHVIFKGKVQGVSFRNTVEDQANKYGVYGTAENLKDKSVECYFYGRMRDITTVIAYMLAGDGLQRVTDMDFHKIKTKQYNKFEVIREKVVWEGYGGMFGGSNNSQSRFKDFFGYSYGNEELYPNQKKDDIEFWEQMEKNKIKVPKEHEKIDDEFLLHPLKKLEEDNKLKGKSYMYDDFSEY